MKKKLLYIVEAMGGGIFTYIVDMANQLADKYDIYIAYALRPQTPESYTQYFDKRVKLIRIHNFTRSIKLTSDIKAFFEIRNVVREIQPDIVHLHSSKAGILGRWAINPDEIPVFYTPHGYSFLMADQSSYKRFFYKLLERVSARKGCTTISCSKGEHEETLKITHNAIYVNNGINVGQLQELLDSINDSTEDRPFTVFTLGRIGEQKNPILFNSIAKAMPDIQFLWIGDGELKSCLDSDNIEITGWIERKEALKKALNADVFILTSLWEGLPMSLLEAMYMKKLCIVSNVIGNKDVISTNVNGFVCESKDEFVSSIQIARNTEVTNIIDKAYKDIISQYNINTMVKAYSKIYENGLKC